RDDALQGMASALQLQRRGAAEDGFGGGGEAAVGAVKDEAGKEAGRRRDLLAGAQDDALRRLPLARPQREDRDVARLAGEEGKQRLDAVGAVDDGDAALGADHEERDARPGR